MYTSPNYRPENVVTRYLRCDTKGEFTLFEGDAAGQTIRESIPNLASFPAEKIELARRRAGLSLGLVQV